MNSIEGVITFIDPNFRYFDKRGSLIQLVREGWSQVNYITSEAGSNRGGHFHKYNNELFFVIEGSFNLALCFKGETYDFSIQPFQMFIIHNDVDHSFKFTERTSLISMYDQGVEQEEGMDIHQGESMSKSIMLNAS